MSLLAGSSVLNEMPPSKHIEHTTVDETPPDFSGQPAHDGSLEQIVERALVMGLLLTTGCVYEGDDLRNLLSAARTLWRSAALKNVPQTADLLTYEKLPCRVFALVSNHGSGVGA